MKKITSLALVMILVLTTLAVGTLFASATQAKIDVSSDTLTFSGGTDASKPSLTESQLNSIKKVVFSDDITTVRSSTLAGLPNAVSVSFGKKVSDIAADAFRDSTSSTQIEKFEVDSANPNYKASSDGKYLLDKEERKLVHAAMVSDVPTPETFPNLVVIGDYAFERNNITGDSSGKIVIPDSVRVIGKRAFANNSIRSIEKFGTQLNDVGEEAFADCSLTSIGKIENPKLYVGKNAFLNDAIMSVEFNGSESEWSDMTVNDSSLRNATHTLASVPTEWVVFDSLTNGGSLNTNPQNIKWDASDTANFTINVADPKYKDSSKSFLGWSTSSSSSSPEYTSSNNVIKSDGKVRSVRLYAIFGTSTGVKVKITFDAQGGELPDSLSKPVETEKDKSYTIPSAKPTNTKYDFLGWALKANADKVDYKPGESFKPTEDTTLYAVWNTEGPFTVKFDGNGDDKDPVTGVPESKTEVKKGTSLTENDPSRYLKDDPAKSRYTFLGWSENKAAKSPAYPTNTEPGKEGTTDISNITSNLTLYAIWSSEGPYEVKFYSDWDFSENSKCFMEDESYTFNKGNELAKGQVIVIPEFPDNGTVTCDCWLADNGLTQFFPGDQVAVKRDLVIYPNWNHEHHDSKASGRMSVTGTIDRKVGYKTIVNLKAEVRDVTGVGMALTGDNLKAFVNRALGEDIEFNGNLSSLTEKQLADLESYLKQSDYNYEIDLNNNAINGAGYYILVICEGRDAVAYEPVLFGESRIEYTTPQPLTKNTEYTIKLCDPTYFDSDTGVYQIREPVDFYHLPPVQGANGPLIAKITVKVNQTLISRIKAFFRTLFNRFPVEYIGDYFYSIDS